MRRIDGGGVELDAIAGGDEHGLLFGMRHAPGRRASTACSGVNASRSRTARLVPVAAADHRELGRAKSCERSAERGASRWSAELLILTGALWNYLALRIWFHGRYRAA